jgi:tRNA pseudouridine38-40 synthase
VVRDGEFVLIDVTANAFLHHMVRNFAGALMRVGLGESTPDWVRTVLDERDRTRAGITAPPQGLYLRAIDYPASFGLPGAVAAERGLSSMIGAHVMV